MGQINQSPLSELHFNKFGGGYAGAKAATTLNIDEAQDLDNIIVLPNGGGFRSRQGNSEEPHSGNLSTVVNPVQGIISFKKTSTEHLIWCTNNSGGTVLTVYEHDISGSTHTSRHTIASGADGQNNIFTMFRFKDLVIGVSNNQSVPFKIDMSGTPSGAVLGGSPPSGKVGIAWNNCVWIGNTSTDPSKLYYSVINNPEDWSSAGTGFVHPQQKDGDELIGLAPISNNVMLYFKRHSIFQVVGRADPFSVYPLFTGVGLAGKNAMVVADGLVYFVTPEGKFKITDGNRIYDDKDIPAISNADDLWANVPKTRLSYIQGIRQQGTDFDHAVFMVSYGSATKNNRAIVWDIKNKCWLTHSTGWNGNCATTLDNGTVYIGGYKGRLYKQDDPGIYTDDSADDPTIDGSNNQIIPTNPDSISWFWRTDHLSLNSLYKVIQIERVNILSQHSSSVNLSVSWGYDGQLDASSITKSIATQTGFTLGSSLLGTGILGDFNTYVLKDFRLLGRGQTVNLKISSSSAVSTVIGRFTVVGRQQASKVYEVR